MKEVETESWLKHVCQSYHYTNPHNSDNCFLCRSVCVCVCGCVCVCVWHACARAFVCVYACAIHDVKGKIPWSRQPRPRLVQYHTADSMRILGFVLELSKITATLRHIPPILHDSRDCSTLQAPKIPQLGLSYVCLCLNMLKSQAEPTDLDKQHNSTALRSKDIPECESDYLKSPAA